MLNKLLFHERCNNDVLLIASKIKPLGNVTLNKFKDQLMEVYQLIYENRNSGLTLFSQGLDVFSKNRDIRFIEITHFDCYVVYKVKPHAIVIVLGIIERKRIWHDLSKINFGVVTNI